LSKSANVGPPEKAVHEEARKNPDFPAQVADTTVMLEIIAQIWAETKALSHVA